MQLIKRIACICMIFVVSLQSTLFVQANPLNKPVYTSNVKENKKIALTFDDGPHPRNTPKILEVLEKYGVKATFFVIGVNVKNYPETLSKIEQCGHEIGNHTYSHKVLKSKSKEDISEELLKTEKEISKSVDYTTSLVRPPCGLYDEKLVELALENDYKIILWNVDTKDWNHESCDTITSKVTKEVKGGDIILFHDYISGVNNTPAALEKIIPLLLNQGFEFVTVSQLLQDI